MLESGFFFFFYNDCHRLKSQLRHTLNSLLFGLYLVLTLFSVGWAAVNFLGVMLYCLSTLGSKVQIKPIIYCFANGRNQDTFLSFAIERQKSASSNASLSVNLLFATAENYEINLISNSVNNLMFLHFSVEISLGV